MSQLDVITQENRWHKLGNGGQFNTETTHKGKGFRNHRECSWWLPGAVRRGWYPWHEGGGEEELIAETWRQKSLDRSSLCCLHPVSSHLLPVPFSHHWPNRRKGSLDAAQAQAGRRRESGETEGRHPAHVSKGKRKSPHPTSPPQGIRIVLTNGCPLSARLCSRPLKDSNSFSTCIY